MTNKFTFTKRDYVIYIAGPYKSKTSGQIMINIENAAKMGSIVRKCGFSATIPHVESIYYESCLSEDEWLDHGLSLLKRCDALIAIKGWENSNGTKKEIEVAKNNHIPVLLISEKPQIQMKKYYEGNTLIAHPCKIHDSEYFDRLLMGLLGWNMSHEAI